MSWLSLSSGGVLSGTPTGTEYDTVTVQVQDNSGNVQQATYPLNVLAAGQPFDYYISPTGSDSNAGTLSAPFAITSLRDASSNNSKFAGKRVGLLPGTYPVGTMTSGSQPTDYEHPVLHLPAGTSGASTYIGSSNSSGFYSARTATLDYSAATGPNSCIGQNPGLGGYWIIDGLVITGGSSGSSSKQIGYYPGNGAGQVQIVNCDMGNMSVSSAATGSNDGPIFMQGATNALIQNNYFHDVHKPAQADHVHAFIEYNGTGTQFLYNTIMRCDTGVDGKVNDNGCTLAYNYFYACSTSLSTTGAIQGYDGDQNSTEGPNYIHHNVFDTCGGEIKLCDVSSTIQQPLQWYNNTCYDTRTGSVQWIDLRCTVSGGIKHYNNICVTTAATGGYSYGRLALTANNWSLCDYNDYFYSNQTGGWGQGTVYNSFATWQASANSPDAHSTTANPQFVSGIVGGNGPAQFQLNTGSPCLGTGQGGVNMGAWDGVVTQIGANWVSY